MTRRRFAVLDWGTHHQRVRVTGDWPGQIKCGHWLFQASLGRDFLPKVRRTRGRDLVDYRTRVDLLEYPMLKRVHVTGRGSCMAKQRTKSKHRKAGASLVERQLRVERQMLERGVRHQRKVRELARTLQRATAEADRALRDVGRMVMDREVPPERQEAEPEAARG